MAKKPVPRSIVYFPRQETGKRLTNGAFPLSPVVEYMLGRWIVPSLLLPLNLVVGADKRTHAQHVTERGTKTE